MKSVRLSMQWYHRCMATEVNNSKRTTPKEADWLYSRPNYCSPRTDGPTTTAETAGKMGGHQHTNHIKRDTAEQKIRCHHLQQTTKQMSSDHKPRPQASRNVGSSGPSVDWPDFAACLKFGLNLCSVSNLDSVWSHTHISDWDWDLIPACMCLIE